MKSFQTKNPKLSKAPLKKCIQGRSKPSFTPLASSYQHVHPGNPIEEYHDSEDQMQSRSQSSDPFKQNLKSIISQNQAYFRNKLKAADDGRPNNLKLKIPSKTGGTTYKRDYHKSVGGSLTQKASQNRFIPQRLTNVNNFFDQTTYKTQFVHHKEHVKKIQKKKDRTVDQNAPAFLETQYKNTFLNWGGNNNVPSMKPSQRPAVTNLHLQTHSAYKLDYTKKTHVPVQSFKPIPSILPFKEKENKNHNCALLTYTTTSQLHYDSKNPSKEQNLKPKTQTLNVSGSYFKGKTEYQNQFMSGNSKFTEERRQNTLEELHNLMLGQ